MLEWLLASLVMISAAFILDREPPPPPPPVADTILLLPDEDGNVGKLVVRSNSGSQTLDRAYATVDVDTTGAMSGRIESESSVKAEYGALLDATPPPPRSFVVTFEAGSAEQLTQQSQAQLQQMQAYLLTRPAPEILVIGHTDRVGSQRANDKLAASRAQSVKQLIEQAGVKALRIEASGRGERENLVPTADGVAEPRNRRVEISVR